MKNFCATLRHDQSGLTRAPWKCAGKPLELLAVLGVAFLTAAASAQGDIHANLVVHLTFDGDVLDHSGNGNDGTIVRPGASSPYVPAIIRQGFQTVGLPAGPGIATNNFITFGSPAGLNFTDTDFSFSWWGQFQPSPTQDEIAWLSNKDWTSGSLTGWVLASGDTLQPGQFKWNYRARGEGRRDSPLVGAGLDDGNWHHYVVTFTRQGDALTYLDGVQVDDTPLNSSNPVQNTFGYPINIFQDGTGDFTDSGVLSYWNQAAIADLGIWQRAITADEVATIYNQGVQGISAFD
jgi:hypothetical protein